MACSTAGSVLIRDPSNPTQIAQVDASGQLKVVVAGGVGTAATMTTFVPAHTAVDCGIASTTLLAGNASRKAFCLYNHGVDTVFLNIAGGAATAAAGMPLPAGSFFAVEDDFWRTTFAVTGIVATTTSSVRVIEFV